MAGAVLEAGGGFAVILSLVNASVLLGGVTDTTLSSSSPSSSSSSWYAGFSLARKQRIRRHLSYRHVKAYNKRLVDKQRFCGQSDYEYVLLSETDNRGTYQINRLETANGK